MPDRITRKAFSVPAANFSTTSGNRLRAVDSDSGPESPEALVISAFLDSGNFDPARHGVGAEDLSCWNQLWNFCLSYQNHAGQAPSLDLVSARHADFEYVKGVDLGWALGQLRSASAGRDLRRRMAAGITALREEDVDGAFAAFDGLRRGHSAAARKGMSIFDTATVIVPTDDLAKLPVPWQSAGRATGGIGPGELWYLAARLGQGKTWSLISIAMCAAKAGARVRYLSLEMRARAINTRAQIVLAGRRPEILRMLHSDSVGERKDALEILAASMPGTFDVIDSSHGRITVSTACEAMADADLVLVDHVGLMSTASGSRAIEDWRVMATISNSLKEATLMTGVPILGAAQINREGDSNGPRPPKVSQLSQSDALGQDGDVVITMKKLSKTVQAFSAEKVREGQEARWYADFQPDKGRFHEINRELAMERAAMDVDEDDQAI